MATAIRIENVTIPANKRVEIALTAIYGIGRKRAIQLCKLVDVSHTVKFSSLTNDEIEKLRGVIKELEVEGNLRRRVAINIKRLKDIRCYRGLRHRQGLPLRGQRTKTNARTRKKRKG